MKKHQTELETQTNREWKIKIKEVKWTKKSQRNRENRFSKIIMITSKNHIHTNCFSKKKIRNPKEHYWKKN
jgi:hypothetical protein